VTEESQQSNTSLGQEDSQGQDNSQRSSASTATTVESAS
jgi:hypothetical protein